MLSFSYLQLVRGLENGRPKHAEKHALGGIESSHVLQQCGEKKMQGVTIRASRSNLCLAHDLRATHTFEHRSAPLLSLLSS